MIHTRRRGELSCSSILHIRKHHPRQTNHFRPSFHQVPPARPPPSSAPRPLPKLRRRGQRGGCIRHRSVVGSVRLKQGKLVVEPSPRLPPSPPPVHAGPLLVVAVLQLSRSSASLLAQPILPLFQQSVISGILPSRSRGYVGGLRPPTTPITTIPHTFSHTFPRTLFVPSELSPRIPPFSLSFVSPGLPVLFNVQFSTATSHFSLEWIVCLKTSRGSSRRQPELSDPRLRVRLRRGSEKAVQVETNGSSSPSGSKRFENRVCIFPSPRLSTKC